MLARIISSLVEIYCTCSVVPSTLLEVISWSTRGVRAGQRHQRAQGWIFIHPERAYLRLLGQFSMLSNRSSMSISHLYHFLLICYVIQIDLHFFYFSVSFQCNSIRKFVFLSCIFYISFNGKFAFLVACYATLHPAMSVRWSVGWSVSPLFRIRLLPKCPSDLSQHCSCPPTCD